MCGIAGYVRRGGFVPSPGQVDRLTGALAHRGPDGEGRLEIGDTTLVHRRLAIIDLETGDQPFQDRAGVSLIANGEIYNYRELTTEIGPGTLSTKSDCELPLHLYKYYGLSFTHHLRGMYALAIHDSIKGQLILARDPFGIKPLYYVSSPHYFAFASEAQALIEAGFAPRTLSPGACRELLNKQFISGKCTAFEEIFRVLPGETLVVKQGEIVEKRYLSALPERCPSGNDFVSLESQLDAFLMESVDFHQRADVPYGMFLSGGVDSSALLTVMARLNSEPVLTYTAGFGSASVPDETSQARAVAKALGATHVEVNITEKDFWRDLPNIAAALDDPCADYAIVPSYGLAREAAKDVKVILSGEGGDELFAGYGRYRRALRPRWLGGRDAQRNGFLDQITVLKKEVPPEPRQNTMNLSQYTRLQALQAEDFVDWLPHDLLIKLDRCLMSHGLEGRTPFLDKPLADFVFCLPDREKVNFRRGKKLLRSWLDKRLPNAQAFARKKGFTVPISRWLGERSKELGGMVSRQPGIQELCVPDTVVSVFGTRSKRAVQASWRLLFFSLWHRRHVLGLVPEGDVFDCLSASSEH